MQISATLSGMLPLKKQKTQHQSRRLGTGQAKTQTNGREWLGISLAAAILALSALHLFSVNYNVGVGYQIAQAQKRIAALNEENRRLMLKASETGSIANIQQNFSEENFVPVTSVDYVTIQPETAVSMK